MPITELRPDGIRQVCTGCGAARDILHTQLVAGSKRESVIDPYIIELPPCASCGAREFLIRSSSAAELVRVVPGSYGHLHRLLVDRLHRNLVEGDRVVEGADKQEFAQMPATDQELERWLGEGLVLPPPPPREERE